MAEKKKNVIGKKAPTTKEKKRSVEWETEKKKHNAKVVVKEKLSSEEFHFKENARLKAQDQESKLNEAVSKDIESRLARVKPVEFNPWREYGFIALLIIASSLLVTLSLDIFVRPNELYGSGLRGITQTIFYAIFNNNDYEKFGWVAHLMFFGANIPLVIFGWLKIGKRFTFISVVFMALIFMWSFITPLIRDDFRPYGDADVANLKHITPYIGALIGGMSYGLGLGLIFRAGGSNGGMKFPIAYIALKNRTSIGHLSKVFGVYVVMQGIFINRFLMDSNTGFIQAFSSPQFFATIILILVSNTVFDKVFPKNKMVQMQITTSRPRAVIAYFKKIDYNRSFMEFKGYGGFKQKKRTMISFVVTQFEVKKYSKIARTIDKNCFVSLQEIDGIRGKFKVKGYK